MDLDVPRRQHTVLPHEDIVNVRRSEVTGEQILLIEIDHDLHVLTSVRMRQNDPWYRHEQGTDTHVGNVLQFRWRHVVGADFEHGHRYRGWRETHDHGRGNVGRQRLDDVLCNAHNIRFGPAHLHPVLQINIGNAAAVVRVTMNVLDAFHCRGQETFEQIRDASLHLLRQQSGIDPDDGGDGNRDIRKDVGWHVEYCFAAQQYDQDRHDEEGIRPSQSNEDDLVHPRDLNFSYIGHSS